MHPNARRVQEALAALGSIAEVVVLEQTARSAEEAAESLGVSVAQIAKSLVFEADGEPVLVIVSGVNRVCTAKVGSLLGARITRADAEAVRAATGFPIGGIPPVAHATPLRTLVDEDLLAHPEVWAAAGTPHAVFRTTGAELVKLTNGTAADVRDA